MAAKALADEPGAATGDVHIFSDQIRIDAGGEVLKVEVNVFQAAIQFGGVVIAQALGVEVFEIALGGDEGAARLGHLAAVDGQEAVTEDAGRGAEAGVMQLGGPEQGVEIEDVLADEVIQLGLGIGPPEGVEVDPAALTVIFETAHVTDRCIEPYIVKLARRIGDLKAKVGRIARDIPVGQAAG